MCDVIAIAKEELPDSVIERRNLSGLIHTRNGKPEIRFAESARRRFLAVWWDGELTLLPWGNRFKTTKLPLGSTCSRTSLEAGSWAWLSPEPVEIVATFARTNGFWFDVPGGMKGVVVRDPRGRPHVYLLVGAATHYYRTMTRSDIEPVFLGPQI